MMPFGSLLVKLSGIIIREKTEDEENASLEAKRQLCGRVIKTF